MGFYEVQKAIEMESFSYFRFQCPRTVRDRLSCSLPPSPGRSSRPPASSFITIWSCSVAFLMSFSRSKISSRVSRWRTTRRRATRRRATRRRATRRRATRRRATRRRAMRRSATRRRATRRRVMRRRAMRRRATRRRVTRRRVTRRRATRRREEVILIFY